MQELDFDDQDAPAPETRSTDEVLTREAVIDGVEAALKRADYAFDIEAGMYKHNGGLWDREHVVKALRVYKSREFVASKLMIEVALAEYEHAVRKHEKQLLVGRINYYDANIGDVAAREVLAFLQRCAPAEVSHLDAHALMSMIWQIKRKFNGHYGLQNPLMLFFTGGQESGKTAILSRILEPVKPWVGGNTTFKVFRDRGSKGSFGNYYILPFNDAGERDLRSSDMDELKSLITETDFAFRAPYGKQEVKVPNIATCFSTSNWDVSSLIADDTGARRWWEIKTPNVTWEAGTDDARARALPIERLWRSVNGHSAQNPRTPYISEYRLVQNQLLKHESLLEECLGSGFTRTGKEGDALTQDEAFAHFVKVWTKFGSVKDRPRKKALWSALLKLAPLKKHDGFTTSTDNVFIFRGLVADCSTLE